MNESRNEPCHCGSGRKYKKCCLWKDKKAAAEYHTTPEVPIRFLAMSRKGDGPVQIQTGDTLADLPDNPILDEFAEHYQREQEVSLKLVAEKRPSYAGW
jgi:hypothetical protein